MPQAQAQQPSEKQATTVDAEDVARFSAIAGEWWDPKGKFKPLHQLNPARIRYLRDTLTAHFPPHKEEHGHPQSPSPHRRPASESEHPQSSSPHRGPASAGEHSQSSSPRRGEDGRGAPSPITSPPPPLTGLTLLDIGCGGGLIAEPMARLGATVTGIDASAQNIAVASLHAGQSGLDIAYRATTAEDLANTKQTFDVVLALEIIEHVADTGLFLTSLARLVKPGGILILSTLNRTAKSYLMAIIGAEYVLRWLPRGTHSWNQFIRPSELARATARTGLEVKEIKGLTLNPATWEWATHPTDLDVNYFLTATKPA